MPTPEYLAEERRQNARRTNRESLWAAAALVGLALLIWACGGAGALL
ncbi:hypothetical protein [Hymenobacter sp.]|nr:hypothetical protein [Hymenobacter sp.]